MTEGTSCSAARKIFPQRPENAPKCPPYRAIDTLFFQAVDVLHIHLQSIHPRSTILFPTSSYLTLTLSTFFAIVSDREASPSLGIK